MKLTNHRKALALSLVAGFLMAACGSGGGGGRRYNNQNIDVNPDAVTWINPSNGQTDVCRRAQFEVSIDDNRACNWQDVSNAFTLFSMSTGPDVPIPLTTAAPINVGNGVCKFIFRSKKALNPFAQYGLAFLDTPRESVGIQRDSVTFRTGDLQGSSCSRQESFFPMSVDGLPNAQLILSPTDPYTVNQQTQSIEYQWDDFAESFVNAIGPTLMGLLQYLLGFRLADAYPEVTINFNEAVDPASVNPGSIQLYEMNGFVSLSSVDLSYCPGQPSNKCIWANGDKVEVRISGGGLVEGKNHILVVSRAVRSQSGMYLENSYFSFVPR